MSIHSSFPFRLVTAATLFLIVTAFAFGQSTGAIQGTVTDASGAAVPNATITVKDPAHGVTRTQATDSTGIYYVPSLPVGTYSVEVKASGLAVTEAKGLWRHDADRTSPDYGFRRLHSWEQRHFRARRSHRCPFGYAELDPRKSHH